MMPTRNPTLIAVTGPKRAGKTTLCARLVARCVGAGWQVGGALAPDRTHDGAKVGIDVVWLRDGRRRSLARIVPDGDAATVGEYAFDDAVLAQTLAVLLRDLATPLDLVVIDEIGRLELMHDGGYAPALAAVVETQARVVLFTVRESYVEALAERLAPAPLQVVNLGGGATEGGVRRNDAALSALLAAVGLASQA